MSVLPSISVSITLKGHGVISKEGMPLVALTKLRLNHIISPMVISLLCGMAFYFQVFVGGEKVLGVYSRIHVFIGYGVVCPSLVIVLGQRTWQAKSLQGYL
jgi:hypothetical protein